MRLRELVVVGLCAFAVLSPMHVTNVQDRSRFCLSEAILHGRLTVDRCIGGAVDRSRYDGHLYSNKAPGMSLLAVPAVAVAGYTSTVGGQRASWQLWFLRLVACGLPFVWLLVLLFRAAESVAPGTGGLTTAAFAAGSVAAMFVGTAFDHVPTAAFGFAAFFYAWRRRPLVAGVCAGAAVLCEYQAAAILAIVAGYVAWTAGRRAVGRFALGAAPGVLVLAAYDWLAFGAPWHTPLAYSDNVYRTEHDSGLLGVQLPHVHATHLTLWGSHGLIVLSPVVVAAAAGLVLVARRLRAEAVACGLVTLAFLAASCGYFDPIGGLSPAPRFTVAALPFLYLGLAEAFRRFFWPALLLALASVASVGAVLLTFPYLQVDSWSTLAGLRHGTSSALATHLVPQALNVVGVNSLAAASFSAAAVVAALLVSVRMSR